MYVCRCLCAVGIWAETDIDSRIAEQSSDVNDFLESVLSEMVLSNHSIPVRPLQVVTIYDIVNI